MSQVEAPAAGWSSFDELREHALACRNCPLAETRTQVVFGAGDPDADLVFVGEGPGAEEDRQGIPFVGRAGGLLTRLIEGIGLTRDDVYIANVVKCRPPGNRDPLPLEIDACRPYLEAQLGFIRPRVLVTLGNFATKLLLDTKEGITKLRGQRVPVRRRRSAHPDAAPRRGAARRRHAARADPGRLRARQARARPPGPGVVTVGVADEVVVTSRSPDETRAAGARSAHSSRVATWSCSTASSGRARPSSRRASPKGSTSTATVVSPTFTLAREYAGRLRLVHVDVYRLDHVQEFLDLGLDDLSGDDAVTVVEWGDAVAAELPVEHLEVRLALPDESDDERELTVRFSGASWQRRAGAVRAALATGTTGTG